MNARILIVMTTVLLAPSLAAADEEDISTSAPSVVVIRRRAAGTQSTSPSQPVTLPAKVSDLVAGQDKRKQIQQLVQRLASVPDSEIPEIEKSLFEQGIAVMVPLKLAQMSENLELRMRAAKAVSRLRWRFACDPKLLGIHSDLIDIMSGDDARERAAKVDQIAAAANADAIGFLGECLADPQIYVRQRAIEGLAQVAQKGDKSGKERASAIRVLETAMADSDRNIRLLVVGTLAELRAANIEKLSRLLDDDSMEVRLTAVRAMGFSEDTSALAHLKPLLVDPQWRIRAAAIEAMGKLVDSGKASGYVALMVSRLDDEDDFVRSLAAMTLGQWRSTAAGPRLLQMVREGKLSDETGFECLARMQYRPGLDELLSRYGKVSDVPGHVQLLRMMNGYENAPEVDRLLKAALSDPQMKPHWTLLISLASQRSSSEFFSVFCGFLESEAPGAAQEAWKAVQSEFSNKPLPQDIQQRLLDSGDGQKGCWALTAAYSYNARTLTPLLLKCLQHPSGDVASLALGMIAKQQINDDLGRQAPRYQRTESSPYSRGRSAPAPSGLPTATIQQVQVCLTRPEPPVRVCAAALLYRSGTDSGPQVLAALKTGLTDQDAKVREVALAGIMEKPEPFLDNVDLEAAGRDPQTHWRAIAVMARAHKKYIKTLIEMSRTEPDEDGLLMKALVRSGDEEAMAVVRQKLQGIQETDSYRLQQMVEELAGVPGPGPVRFIEAVLERKVPEYYQRSLVQTLLTLPDPSAKNVLKKMSTNTNVRDQWGAIRVRLAELDPTGESPGLSKSLVDGDPNQQSETIRALTKGTPTTQMVDVVLEASRNRGKEAVGDWVLLGRWLPPEAVRQKFLPALGDLNPSMQQGIMLSLASSLEDKDLDVLMNTGSGNPFVREYQSAMLGMMTADNKAVRPDLTKLPDKSLPAVLGAAGDWDDAPDVLAPYLNDTRTDVAAGACRGLAMYLLGHPHVAAGEEWRDAMSSAVKGDDAITAYLAAEAMAMRWSDALAKIDPASIKTPQAALCQAIVMGKDAPAPVRQKVAQALSARTASGTSTRLALLAAGQAWDPSYRFSADLAYKSDPQLAARAAIASGKDENLSMLPDIGLGRPSPEVLERLRGLAHKGNNSLLLRMAQRRWMDSLTSQEYLRLLSNVAVNQATSDPSDALDVLLAYAPDSPDGEIIKKVSPKSTPGILAASVAAIQWKSPEARKALVAAAISRSMAQSSMSGQTPATVALRICAQPEDVSAIIAGMNKLPEDDYQSGQVRDSLKVVLAGLGTPDAHRAVTSQPSGDRMIHHRSYYGSDNSDLTAVWADDKDWPGENDRGQESKESPLVPALVAAKGALGTDGLKVTSTSAASTSQAALPADDASPTRTLIPPWDKSLDSEPEWTSRGAVAARDRLERMIESVKSGTGAENEPGDADGLSPLESPIFMQANGLSSQAVAMNKARREQSGLAAEEYHLSKSDSWPVGIYLSDTEVGERLSSLLASESAEVRIRAMRAAADLQALALEEKIAGRLSAEGVEAVEAAWALAMLKGPEASGRIEPVYQRQKDSFQRLRLACLLKLLGSDAGRADIDRAMGLRTVRTIRMKFIGAMRVPRYEYGPDDPQADSGKSIDDLLMPWKAALDLAAPEMVKDMQARLRIDVPSELTGFRETQPWTADWVPGLTGRGTMSIEDLPSNGLPLIPLVKEYPSPKPDTVFGSLCEAEQDYEKVFFVQFADQAVNTAELADRWSVWWAANKSKPREQWWAEATGQAVAEMTHAKWWHRMRAARRLERLTGRGVQTPGVFDMAAWTVQQERWRGWLKDNSAQGPRVWLLAAGVEAKVLPAGAQTHGGDDGAYLADLVHLAGFAPAPLAEAALLQLEGWPDERQLVRASLAWQHSPRRDLAGWARGHLKSLLKKPRLECVQSDLAESTGPSAKAGTNDGVKSPDGSR